MSFLLIILAVMLAAVVVVCILISLYSCRLRTMLSIEKRTSCDSGYDLYRMNIGYDYSIDRIIRRGITDNQSFINSIVKEAIPLLPVYIKAPDFGCSAFCVTDRNGDVRMGRNYDFANNTSAMLVYCAPKNGYRSMALSALDNLSANLPLKNMKTRLASLVAPFVCLDGMNEKGVSIAVLTLDSEPVRQNTGKPVIATTLAIRLVLDRAATTAEAVKLLEAHDMFASSGRDYHFYITDATGDGRIVEFDCHDKGRRLVATPVRAATNFFEIYKDKVRPNQHNGIYGHGMERYEIIEKILTEHEGDWTPEVVWQALQAASQKPKAGDVTSNTQWSAVYNNSKFTVEIALRRDWSTVTLAEG